MHLGSVVVFVAAMMACLVRDTTSCSCQPSHPQDHFCRATYVIRARVTHKLYIYPEPQPDPLADSSSFSEVSFSDSDWGLETNEGTNGAPHMPPGEGLLEAPIGLAALPRLPEVRVPAGMEPLYVADTRPLRLEYTVKVEKIYKGDQLLMPKTSAKIATAAIDAACGQTDLRVGEVYIITGSFYNAELRVSSCNWVEGYKNITKRQRQGIKHNYKMHCGKCDISPCYGRYCPKETVADRCMWDLAHLRDNCESQFAYCKRNTQNDCVWYGKADLRKCVRRRLKGSKPRRNRHMP